MSKYAVFWGCQIPARLAFLEKATRLVLAKLEVDIADLPGFTCCPDKTLIRNTEEDAWYLAAARNLALAEREGLDLLTPCNGCYATFKTVNVHWQVKPGLSDRINAQLMEIGLHYNGSVKVQHLLGLLHDEIGTTKLQQAVVEPLTGLSIGVHYGCHILRPSSYVDFDDPFHPTKFDNLVTTLGAKSLDYSTKLLCCGQSYLAVGQPERATAMTRTKLNELQQLGAHAITTNCPACFLQYDLQQFTMQRQGEKLSLPAFYYPELLALAMGIPGEEFGIDMHKVDTSSFFEARERERARGLLAKQHFNIPIVERCFHCGGCLQDCPAHQSNPWWNPNEIMGEILNGDLEELLKSEKIWMCTECYTCYDKCPQRFGMMEAFSTLRRLASERRLLPEGVRRAVDAFFASGRLIEPMETQRKRLGLPTAPKADKDELRRMFEMVRKKG